MQCKEILGNVRGCLPRSVPLCTVPDEGHAGIFTILTNKCKKKWKKVSKESSEREEEFPEQSTLPDYDLAIDVRKAFFVLSEEEQILVGLSVFGGYCSQEIGEMMKLNPNTVRSKRSRALRKMECVLDGYREHMMRQKGVKNV